MHGGPPQGRASVVDMGSNSIKLANYYVWPDNSYKPYHHESIEVRLGDGLQDGAIRPKYAERAVEALRMFRSVVQFEQIEYVVAVATSAVREASNRGALLGDISEKTGFSFSVLSERHEAEYSFVGAMRSLDVPSCVMFDLGGGSLELVRSEEGRITDVRSLPLGSLRLTREFGSAKKMRERVRSVLPSAAELGAEGLPLVGVGGAVRALAKHEQHLRGYKLSKAHNYRLEPDSVSDIYGSLSGMEPGQIARLGTIGRGRSETIAAGACVIAELSRELGPVTVSAQGLREGVLAAALCGHPAGREGSEYGQALVGPERVLPETSERLLGALRGARAVSEREARLLREALGAVGKLWEFRDAANVLSSIMDDDSSLDHRDQLVVALSLVSSKKRRRAEALASDHDDLLEGGDAESARRMGSVVAVCDLLHRTGARLEARGDGDGVRLTVRPPGGAFPEALMGRACGRLGEDLGIAVAQSVEGARAQEA